MLSETTYSYLRTLLATRKVTFPEQAIFMFSEDFVAAHLKCHLTAMHVAVEWGYPPVIGIQFIDLHGKLYPWPHMVNRRDDTLIDGSPKPNHRVLGFIETSWDELAEWRGIVAIYNEMAHSAELPNWGDPLADRLTAEFMDGLQAPTYCSMPRAASAFGG